MATKTRCLYNGNGQVFTYLTRTFTDNEVFRNTSKMFVVIHLREILVLFRYAIRTITTNYKIEHEVYETNELVEQWKQ